MIGYATTETEEYMPLPIHLAHLLAKRLAKVRKERILDYLRPDGKTQVTIEYEDGVPSRIDTVVVSAQHNPDISMARLAEDIRAKVIEPVLPKAPREGRHQDPRESRPGEFEKGGPAADTGLTGRKIIVDTYGGYASHGGGAFSGKDPTKVDRSACYAARHVAKNIVAAGLAKRCTIELAYAIGIAQPVSIMIDAARHGRRERRRARGARAEALRPLSSRDHRAPRAATPHLQAHRGVRPLRSRGAGLHVGAAGHGGRAQGSIGDLMPHDIADGSLARAGRDRTEWAAQQHAGASQHRGPVRP